MAEKKKSMHHMEIHLSHPKDGKFHGAEVQIHHEREMGHSSKHGLYMGGTPEPDKKHFGETEGHDLIAHIANHLNIPEEDAAGEGAEDGEDEE